MAVKAYSYIRWSSKAQTGNHSLERQLTASREYASENGLVLDDTLRDEGVSSAHGAHRLKGALSSFLAKVESREIEPGSYLLIDVTP